MLGQVGEDKEGAALVNFLEENGVDVSTIIRHKNQSTGQGFVFSMKETGDNSCVTVGGTN